MMRGKLLCSVLALLLPLSVLSTTTQVGFSATTAEQTACDYDAVSVLVVPDNAATVSEASPQPVPSFGPITGFLAAKGTLTVVEGGSFSVSELRAAEYMRVRGNVTLRPPAGTRAGGGTSDLLVGEMRYDVYTPKTSNPDRIISAIAKKNSQAQGVVVDLSETSVTAEQLGDILARVRGAGAKNLVDVVVIGSK